MSTPNARHMNKTINGFMNLNTDIATNIGSGATDKKVSKFQQEESAVTAKINYDDEDQGKFVSDFLLPKQGTVDGKLNASQESQKLIKQIG